MEFEFRFYTSIPGKRGESTWFFKGADPAEAVDKFRHSYPEDFKHATYVHLQTGKGSWKIEEVLNNRGQVLKDFYANLKFKVIKNGRTLVVCGTINDAVEYFTKSDADEIQRLRS